MREFFAHVKLDLDGTVKACSMNRMQELKFFQNNF